MDEPPCEQWAPDVYSPPDYKPGLPKRAAAEPYVH